MLSISLKNYIIQDYLNFPLEFQLFPTYSFILLVKVGSFSILQIGHLR